MAAMRVPLWLKIGWTGWGISWVPFFWTQYGPAKLPVFLRSGKPLSHARTVVGEPSDFLLAGDGTAAVPEPLRHRLGRGSQHWLAHRRRHGIHVRSQRTFIHSPA